MKKKTTPRTTRQPLSERSVNVPSNVVPIKGKQQKRDKNDDTIVAFVSFSGHVTGCFFVRLVEYLSDGETHTANFCGSDCRKEGQQSPFGHQR